MRQLRVRIALAVTFLILGVEGRAQSIDSSESSEYLIKAGFIYNFAKLVEWPGSAFANSGQPIAIAVVGNDSFAAILERVVDGKKVESRPLVVKRLKWNKDFKDCGCHILFIAGSESSHADDLIQLFKASSVLTIAEKSGFTRQGGIINFILEDSKVRFEVNVDAARQVGLNISSRLLSLAKTVQNNNAWR